MPFTLAHPAIVVPLEKVGKGLSLTGLVIGSLVPDLEYFIQMREVENIGHTWYGILIFDIPVAFCLAFLFHNLLRNSLIANLPRLYRSRFYPVQKFNWNLYARKNQWRILFSIFIGVLSHQGLDLFTHHDSWLVSSIPLLSASINILGYIMPFYFFLQIFLSLMGMAILHWQIIKMPKHEINAKDEAINFRYWSLFSGFFLTLLGLRLFFWPEWNSFGGVLIAMMGSLFYSWILTALSFRRLLSYQ